MGNPNFYEQLMSMANKMGSIPGVDKAAIEIAALRNENKLLKEENERLRNTILLCPCGKKLRIPKGK